MIDHDATIRTMRALADDMDNWPDEDNYSVALNNLIVLASAAKGLAAALQELVRIDDTGMGAYWRDTDVMDKAMNNARAALATFREIEK